MFSNTIFKFQLQNLDYFLMVYTYLMFGARLKINQNKSFFFLHNLLGWL
jgi:hypothetical protein